MVDVTRENFSSVWAEVERAVARCDFLALDCEFTGLDHSIARNSTDDPADRYTRLRHDAATYHIVQVGVATFEYSEAESQYVVRPFNFYVFPFHEASFYPECTFSSLASSLAFLAGNGLDLNKLVSHGVPYLSLAEYDRIKEHIEQECTRAKQEREESGEALRKREEQELLDDKNNSDLIQSARAKLNQLKAVGDSVSFPDLNAFQRRLVYKLVSAHYASNDVIAVTRSAEDQSDVRKKVVLCKKLSPEEDPFAYARNEKLALLDECLGFTKVVKLISESKKLVVGHNMLLDTLHLVHQFFHPLPDTYAEFKLLAASCFPRVADTKVLCSTNPFKEHISRSSLENMFRSVALKPFKKIVTFFPKGYDKYAKTRQCHEAGFDAYMTGFSFAAMLKYLGSMVKPPKQFVSSSSPIVEPFVNKIFIMNMCDIYYIDLANDDPTSNKSNVFYLEFPDTWKSSNIIELFKPFTSFSYVNWKSNTSAFVRLKEMTSPADVVRKSVQTAAPDSVSVSTYEEYCAASKSVPKRTATPTEENGCKQNPEKRQKTEFEVPEFETH